MNIQVVSSTYPEYSCLNTTAVTIDFGYGYCIMVPVMRKETEMKTVKIAVELTVDLSDADEIKDWLEDLIEKNFSSESEEIVSISLFA